MLPKTESKDHKYKLQMKKNTVNPKWNAEVNFNYLDSAEIEDNGIEIQMLHLGKVSTNQLIYFQSSSYIMSVNL